MIRILTVFIAAMLAFARFAAADSAPAGYVMTMSLVGEDASLKSAVVRDGAEIPAKIMMPLFAGDVVFLRDPASRIGIEMGDGKSVEVGGAHSRFEVAGEINTGDSTWSIIAAIGGLVGGDEAVPPDNMVSKGGALKVPMAQRDGNMLLQGRRTLWLGWTGGDGPFTLALTADGRETPLRDGIAGHEAVIDLPDQLPPRFGVALTDAMGQKVVLRFRFANDVPAGPAAAGETGVQALARAAWLTSQQNGAWTVEAAQILRDQPSDAAKALLDRIRDGWTFS